MPQKAAYWLIRLSQVIRIKEGSDFAAECGEIKTKNLHRAHRPDEGFYFDRKPNTSALPYKRRVFLEWRIYPFKRRHYVSYVTSEYHLKTVFVNPYSPTLLSALKGGALGRAESRPRPFQTDILRYFASACISALF